jgi:hypothetical protein
MKRSMLALLVVLALVLAGVSVPASAQTSAERAEKQTAAMQLTSMRITYHHANSALHDVLEAVQEYSIARANNNENGMRTAAAMMLMSLAEARFWMARLDFQVTASQFGEKIDQDVANLRNLLANVFNNLADALFNNDLQAISAGMDESANAFNSLALNTHGVMNALWPRLSSAQ